MQAGLKRVGVICCKPRANIEKSLKRELANYKPVSPFDYKRTSQFC